MANEVKIDQEQFEQLTDWLEAVAAHTDQVADYLSRTNEKLSDLIDAVKAVEASVEGADSDITGMIDETNRALRQRR